MVINASNSESQRRVLRTRLALEPPRNLLKDPFGSGVVVEVVKTTIDDCEQVLGGERSVSSTMAELSQGSSEEGEPLNAAVVPGLHVRCRTRVNT